MHGKSGGYIDIDDYDDMDFLRSSIEGGSIEGSSIGDKVPCLLQPAEETTIQRIAHTLIANFLFFEPYDHQPNGPGGSLQGSVRRRLPHETPATKPLLEEKVTGFYHTSATREEAATGADIASGRWKVLHDEIGRRTVTRPIDMVHEESFEDGSSIEKFRLACTLRSAPEVRPYHIIGVRLGGVDEVFPISGFPATLQELMLEGGKQVYRLSKGCR